MQADELVIEIRNSDLERVGMLLLSDLASFSCIRKFNNSGAWTAQIHSTHHLVDTLRQPGSGIIITTDDGVLFSGFTTTATLEQTSEDPEGVWTISGQDDTSLLGLRLTYPDPSTDDVTAQLYAYDVRTGAAETIMKELVDYNMGPNAPASRQVPGLTIEADTAAGDTQTIRARFKNLGSMLNQVAATSGLGYQILQTNGDLEFSVYEPQDLTSTIRLDVENTSLESSSYSYATPEVTRVIVGGQGEGVDRTFVERSSTESQAAETAWNLRIEQFKDSRNLSVTSELQAEGDAILAESGFTLTALDMTPGQLTNTEFLKDWYLGDSVTAVVGDAEITRVVTEVGIQIDSNGLTLKAVIGEQTKIAFDTETAMTETVNDHEERLTNLELNEPSATGGGGGITEPVETLQFDTTWTDGSDTVGQLAWSSDHDTLEFKLNNDVTLQIGQEHLIRVKNASGSTAIPDLRAVSFAGATGDTITVSPAVSTAAYDPELFAGVTTQEIDADGFGFITQFGFINGVDTSAWSLGDLLYVDPSNPGELTNSIPSAPNWHFPVGAVTRVHAETGRVLIRAIPTGHLHDITDVEISSPADNEVLAYNSANGTWINQTAAEAGLSVTGHTHDDRYYTETEIDTALSAKANLSGANFTGDVTLGSQSSTTGVRELTVTSAGFAQLNLQGDDTGDASEPGGAAVLFGTDATTRGLLSSIQSAGESGADGISYTGTANNSVLLGTIGGIPLHFGTNSAVQATLGTDGDWDIGGKLKMSTSADSRAYGSYSIGTYTAYGTSTQGAPLMMTAGVTNTRYHIGFSINGTRVGGVSTSGSSTTYSTSSDYRLKENVASIADATDRVLQLNPVRFNWIAHPETGAVDGFLAHEVQAIVPEAVTGEKDEIDENGNPAYQGIDQSKLVPLLTAALQQALTKIDSLEARIATLEQN